MYIHQQGNELRLRVMHSNIVLCDLIEKLCQGAQNLLAMAARLLDAKVKLVNNR